MITTDELVLGRYRILRRLARGGMGAVYLGRTEGAEGFARPVVIKRVLPGLSEDREITQLFVREAHILSNLQHPNIVPVLDFGQEANGGYVMGLEYVHGYALSDWHTYLCEARGALPIQHAVHITCKVLDALHYAHTYQRADKVMPVIHRDVTPTNVLLNDQGIVKLVDFGVARMLGDDGDFSTKRAQVRGKLPYLPAEAFRGVEPSVASDVYSTGVMLYELLTGANPFNATQQADVFAKVLELTPNPVDEVREDASTELAAVLRRAMHRDLSVRFSSAAEFASALRGARRGSEDESTRALAAQIREDFLGDMPQQLALEPLVARELTWRGTRSSHNAASSESADPSFLAEEDTSPGDPGQATVRADVPPEVLAQAASSMAPPTRTSDQQPRARPTELAFSRVLLAITASAIVGALAALGAWFTIAKQEPVQERMVVIQRESPAQPTPERAHAGAAARTGSRANTASCASRAGARGSGVRARSQPQGTQSTRLDRRRARRARTDQRVWSQAATRSRLLHKARGQSHQRLAGGAPLPRQRDRRCGRNDTEPSRARRSATWPLLARDRARHTLRFTATSSLFSHPDLCGKAPAWQHVNGVEDADPTHDATELGTAPAAAAAPRSAGSDPSMNRKC